MHAERATVGGNPFVGMFIKCSDRAALVPVDAPEKLVAKCRAALKVEPVRVAIAGSNLVGLFSAANSHGIVLTGMSYREEAGHLKKALGIEVAIVKGRHTAIGNNVLVNDKAAIANPQMSAADIRVLKDTLGVEVVKRSIGAFRTVGSAAVVTNRGLLLHTSVGDEELGELCSIFGVKGSIGTANMGVPFIGVCLAANSHGYVTGEATSGFELARIDEALGFVERG